MIFNWFFLGYECRGKLFGHLENISVDYPRWSVLCHLTLDTFLECLWLRDTKSWCGQGLEWPWTTRITLTGWKFWELSNEADPRMSKSEVDETCHGLHHSIVGVCHVHPFFWRCYRRSMDDRICLHTRKYLYIQSCSADDLSKLSCSLKLIWCDCVWFRAPSTQTL